MRSFKILYLGMLVFTLATFTVTMDALADSRVDKLAAFLRGTNAIISEASKLADESGDERASELAEKADECLKLAVDAFNSDRYGKSFELARRSRDLAKRSIRISWRSLPEGVKFERFAEKAEKVFVRASEEVEKSDKEKAKGILERALALKEKAYGLGSEGNYREAIDTLRQAVKIASEAIRVARGEPDEGKLLRERVEGVRELVGRAVKLASENGNEKGIELARRAREAFGDALSALEKGELRKAKELLDRASKFARRSMKLVKEGDREDKDNAASGETEGRVKLYRNRPNPFNPSTEISYFLPNESYVTLNIYNTLGREVRTLTEGHYPAGMHSVTWDGRDSQGNVLASGIYIYSLRSDDAILKGKMLLQK